MRLTLTIEPANAACSYDKTELRRIMRAALGEIVKDARGRVPEQNQARKRRRRGRVVAGAYISDTAAEHTARDLRRSIKATPRRDGLGGQVKAIFYDRFLELGTSDRVTAAGVSRGKISPQPIIDAAFAARWPSISARIRASIVQGITFQKAP